MQTEGLAYVIVTPYSMRKSRTGGIVGRLISRTGLDLVGGRMFAPSAELAKRYADTIVTETDPRHRATQELIRKYVLKNFTGERNGQQARVLFLIFRDRDAPGTEKSIAIVYQGVDAVRKIRDVLGPTDPAKAPPGSIRREFGQTIMINAAHASDSAENAEREMAIVQIEENNFKPLIENFYRRQ